MKMLSTLGCHVQADAGFQPQRSSCISIKGIAKQQVLGTIEMPLTR